MKIRIVLTTIAIVLELLAFKLLMIVNSFRLGLLIVLVVLVIAITLNGSVEWIDC